MEMTLTVKNTENEILSTLNGELGEESEITHEVENIDDYDDSMIVKIEYEFLPNTSFESVESLTELNPELIKEITIIVSK